MTHATIDLSSLFWQAGPAVKAVFVLLALCSAWCWAIVGTCCLGLWRLRRTVKRTIARLPSPLWDAVTSRGEREAAIHYPDEDATSRRERIVEAMRRHVQVAIEQAQGGLANLAVIASVAPFIGLFGTVWGIMSSFIGIATAKDTSLAVVAPGIAEALLATAIGLAAAIPAAFAYNRFAASFTLAGRALYRLVDEQAPAIVHGARAPVATIDGAR